MKNIKKITKKSSALPRRIKKLAFSRNGIIILLCVLLVIGFVSLTLPKTYEKVETSTLSYGTQYKEEDSIEFGEEKVAQEGKHGLKNTKYRYSKSLFSYLFKVDNALKIEISSEVRSRPTDKVVLKGTKKWQYMMCSNGTYRYFSDKEFKDPSTGFTSKSPDYCAENKQGNKIGLADNPSGKNNVTRPSYVPPNCSIVEIPHKTVYQDVDWLYAGETQQGYGMNGFKYVCSDNSRNSTIAPSDKIIYRGTKQKQQTPSYSAAPSTSTQNYAAKQKCDRDYNHAKAQLSINGAGSSSAMIQIQQIYAQCLARTGYWAH